MVKNSIRQLFRTKVRSCLFFFLITLCALLICLGCNLVKQCQSNMEKFKKVFTTIGTVEQNPVSYIKRAMYDQETKSYSYYTAKEYDQCFSMNELDMKEVTYISGPERRPFYSAYLPDYAISDERWGPSNELVVEASPYEDCIPAGPVKMKIKKVIYSIYEVNYQYFYYCDHFNDNPDQLYADKTYIMSVQDALAHGFRMGKVHEPFEYIPMGGPYSRQTLADGTKIPNTIPDITFEEVNEEYYAKGHDKYWEAHAKELNYMLHKVPVTPTDDLNLIMAFYNGDATIAEGSTFTEEDFTQGNAVCLIPFIFARRNHIKIGDKITLPLRVADYSQPSVLNWGQCPLTATGENFEPFFTEDYTVQGIYRLMPGGGIDSGYLLDDNEIIIPKNSVKADDSNNIGIYGNHISPYNTSFRIQNGTIDEFMKEWEKKGIEDVTIHFYDKGYSKLEEGIKQMEHMAILLLIAGIVMTILVLVFFCSMMIGGQKKRTAIERSLGSSKWECIRSLLIGILLVAATGCLIGCLFAAFMTKGVASVMTEQQIFNRLYSAGMVNSGEEVEQKMSGDFVITVITFLATFGFTVLISGFSAWRNLKEEPLALLSGEKK